ncbi:Retrovirus-related Pol polyprotein from transposon 17.6 [Vitis vinifera]|uniref:Retrovirus-related Pol polyprotein from transposon 17.6 n=1 Tax=Vitis vinifera TaxID=29760 RepID=A0A438JRT2_VITVI|nr:Retrovirus-related Pol polyprotein from transposon 17.6 [Vitis vinifera]
MARLHWERVRACLTCTPFNYPVRPYRMSLANYFIKGSEIHPHMGDFSVVTDIEGVDELQHQFHHLYFLSLCFLEETIDCGVDVEPTRIVEMVQPKSISPFDLFEVSAIEVAEEIQTVLAPELMEDVTVGDDEFEDIFGFIEGTSNFVDPPLSFDILSGFISCSDDDYDSVSMDLSIFEYLPISCDNRDSSNHDSDPINERISPTIGDVETIDFGIEDQPRKLKIGSPLSIDENDRLIHLLRSYLDVFAWSYEDMLVVEYPEWLVNVVLVPKKDGKVRVCVDYKDLNKASPKDDFPLPHIDLLVDSTTGHSMFSFMDGFSGVMPFGLKNVGATYQRAATTLFHDMMHMDVEVYVDDMIMKSRSRANHLAALERFFERIRKFRLRLNPKKCTFRVTSRKLLGHIVSEIQYISHFIARLTDICELIFHLLRKNQAIVWNDDCQIAFKNIKEYLHSPPILVPPMSGHPILLYLSVSYMALGCMLAQLNDSGKERAIYYLSKRLMEYEMRYVMIEHLYLALVWATRRLRHYMTKYLYVSRKSIKGSIVTDHLASLSISKANQSGFGIGILLISPQGDHIPRRFDDLRYTRLPRAQNQFVDALATLASSVDISTNVAATAKDRRALRQLATRFVICGETLYRQLAHGMILLCLDRASADRVMREVHARVCGPHMGGHMLAHKIMRTGYFWLTVEIDCCQFVQRYPECQIHGDLIHAPPSGFHALTSP